MEDNGSIFVKFSDYVEDIQKGNLYMKNLKFYIDQEIRTGVNGQGDRLEAQVPVYKGILTNRAYETIVTVTKSFGYELFPAFCVLLLKPMRVSNRHGFFELSDEQKLEFSNFAKSCISIKNIDEFIIRFKNACEKNGYEYTHSKIEYCDFFNQPTKIKNLTDQNPFTSCFIKDNKFSVQEEYRFIIHKPVKEFLKLDIGDISDISEVFKDCFENIKEEESND